MKWKPKALPESDQLSLKKIGTSGIVLVLRKYDPKKRTKLLQAMRNWKTTRRTLTFRDQFLHDTDCIRPLTKSTPGGGGGVFPRILGGGVPPGSSNPDTISDLNMPFSTPVFRPDNYASVPNGS